MSKLHYFNKSIEQYLLKYNEDLIAHKSNNMENENKVFKLELNKFLIRSHNFGTQK